MSCHLQSTLEVPLRRNGFSAIIFIVGVGLQASRHATAQDAAAELRSSASSANISSNMNRKVRAAFLALILLQAAHSTEEFIFKFYERFPPMRIIYQGLPNLTKPAFAISNLFLFLIGLSCFYYWIKPERKGARTVIWVWIVMESFNAIAHFVWAILIRGYNPGLVTGILFVPLLIYLWHLMRRI